jgi:hypothetical protein
MKLNKPDSCMRDCWKRTLHAKVWMSYAQFEMSSSEEGNVVLARQVQYASETSVRDRVVRALKHNRSSSLEETTE